MDAKDAPPPAGDTDSPTTPKVPVDTVVVDTVETLPQPTIDHDPPLEDLVVEDFAGAGTTVASMDPDQDSEAPPAAGAATELEAGSSAAPESEVLDVLTRLEEEVLTLAAGQSRYHERAEQYEAMIRNLSEERAQLRDDQVRQLLAPVFKTMARLHQRAGESADRAEQQGLVDVAKDFYFLMDEIGDLLADFDVEPVSAQPGEPIEPRLHMVVSTVATADPAADRTIARVLRHGYTYVGSPRPLQPAKVTAHKFVAEQAPTATPQTE